MKPTLIRKESAPQFDVHGARVTGYASPSRGSNALATWRLELAAGASSPLHALEVDEVFLALAGGADFHVGADVMQLRAGDGITVPAGTEFRIVAAADATFEAVVCVPAGCRARVGDGEFFVPPWAM